MQAAALIEGGEMNRFTGSPAVTAFFIKDGEWAEGAWVMTVLVSSEVSHVLLDIEGTTSSVKFVYEVMFPYAREQVGDYLAANWGNAELNSALEKLALDAGQPNLAAWLGALADEAAKRQAVVEAVRQLMDRDAKVTGLKELQGLVWESGFRSGQMVAHLYPDVLPAIKNWKATGKQVWIYSSGSIAAQRLFFGHTCVGDLLPLFSGHFDTTSGGKKEPSSYQAIAAAIGAEPQQILFVSDIVEELQAARQTGLETALSVRPENQPQPPGHGFAEIQSFSELAIQ